MKRNDGAKAAGIGIMASFGLGRFLAEVLTGAFGSLVFMYYETEVGMSGWLVALAIGLYSLWNAVNDPLIGWFTAKPTPLSARFGRRFPWIVSCALLCLGSFYLVFAFPAWAGPAASIGLLFALLLVSTFIFDALYSAWEVNYQSVFPDRFRTHRREGGRGGHRHGSGCRRRGRGVPRALDDREVRAAVHLRHQRAVVRRRRDRDRRPARAGRARDPADDRALPRGAEETRPARSWSSSGSWPAP